MCETSRSQVPKTYCADKQKQKTENIRVNKQKQSEGTKRNHLDESTKQKMRMK